MKRNGNIAVNKIYNPRNKRPDMPLDADEIDSAMERFIRKKYQEKSLADGKPEPPQRNEYSPPVPSKSPDGSPPPPVPSKKHRFFGFGLRASSSAYPLSKHDKKKLPPEPRVDDVFAFSSDDYAPTSRSSRPKRTMSNDELEKKLQQLRDMGFTNTERNTSVLRRLDGNLERSVAALVQLGPSPNERTSSVQATSQSVESSRVDTSFPPPTNTSSAMRSPTNSNNPFDQISSGQGFGLSVASAQQPQTTGASYGSNNPYEQPIRSQTDGGLTGAFQGMQISQAPPPQPLFPHSTGGYPSQQPQFPNPRLQTMTPPVPSAAQQYGYVSSPLAMGNTNPFFQQPVQPQVTGNNPFFDQVQQPQQYQQNFQQQQFMQAQSTNPFMNPAAPQVPQQTSGGFNPFGIPPGQLSPSQTSQAQPVSQIYTQGQFSGSQPQSAISPGGSNPFQQQMNQPQPSSPSPFPNFQYGQPQVSQQSQFGFQQSNPYSGMPQGQVQAAPLSAQQTGRYDKSSILALYNHPQLAPARPQQLSSIPEPGNDGSQMAMPDTGMAPKRSSTMPLSMSSMHSAGGAGNMGTPNRNPFMQNGQINANFQQGMPPQMAGMTRHVSQESVNVNNLDSGRHSPDAFANLSARYVR